MVNMKSETKINLISCYWNDPDLIEVADVFLSDLTQSLQKLQNALKKENWEDIGQVAHYIKGGAASAGFSDYAGLCADLQLSAQKGDMNQMLPLADDVISLGRQLRSC